MASNHFNYSLFSILTGFFLWALRFSLSARRVLREIDFRSKRIGDNSLIRDQAPCVFLSLVPSSGLFFLGGYHTA